jgi:hypothetical protein
LLLGTSHHRDTGSLPEDVYRRRLPTIPTGGWGTREFLRVRARSVVTAVAILVAFAIGCFLGARLWFMPDHSSSSSAEASPDEPKSR